jgi:hypothetical protein
MAIYRNWGLEQLARQQLGELYGTRTSMDDSDYGENIPETGTLVKAQHKGIHIYVGNNRVACDQGTCFKVVKSPDGEGSNWNPTVEILTGKHKGKTTEMPIKDYRNMPEITQADVVEPPKAAKAPKKPGASSCHLSKHTRPH